MNENIVSKIEEILDETMAKVKEAAEKKDLGALRELAGRAEELKQMKEQVLAIQQRLREVGNGAQGVQLAPPPTRSKLREIRIRVSQGMINQNLLTLTEAIRRGTVRVGEEMTIKVMPSEREFTTVVLPSGNKLRERGEIHKFYAAANVVAGDYVMLQETTPGQWKLRKV